MAILDPRRATFELADNRDLPSPVHMPLEKSSPLVTRRNCTR
jgi:hypothetical protein